MIEALDKKPPRAATSKGSVVVSLRRVQGLGTWWGGSFPGLALPAGANMFFALPPVCTCWGVAVPLRGDADLSLMLNNPAAAPPLPAGTAGRGQIWSRFLRVTYHGPSSFRVADQRFYRMRDGRGLRRLWRISVDLGRVDEHPTRWEFSWPICSDAHQHIHKYKDRTKCLLI